MTLTIHLHIHQDAQSPQLPDVLSAVRDLARKVDQLARDIRAEGQHVMKEIDDLTAAVQKNTDAENSAVVLIKGLAEKIASNATDPAKIADLANQLNAQADALAAAVVANTPTAE